MLGNVKKVLKNGAIYGVGTSATKLIGFLLLPSYLKIFSAHQLGILGIVEISWQVLVAVFGLGLYSAVNRFYWDKDFEGKQKSMFFNVILFLFFVVVLMVLGFSLNAETLSLWLFKSKEYSSLIDLFLVSAGLEILILLPSTLMKLQEKPVVFSLSTIVKVSVTLVLIIYFVIYSNRGIEGIYEAQILGCIVYFICIAKYIWKNIEFNFDFGILKTLLKFSYPLIFSSASGVLLTVLGRYILDFSNSLEDVGIYSFGFKIANSVKVFVVTSMQMAISPLIYKMMYKPESNRFYSKIMTYSTFGLMFFVIGLSVFGFEIVELLVNVFAKDLSLREAYIVIPAIVFSGLFGMLIYCSLIGLNIAKKTKIIAGVLIVMLILNYFLNIILIPILDILGVAYATLITQIIYWIVIHLFAQKYYPIPFEISKVVKTLLVGSVLCIIPSFFNQYDLIFRFPLKIITIVIFPVILYYMNFFEEIELLRIKQIFQKWKNPLTWKQNIKELLG